MAPMKPMNGRPSLRPIPRRAAARGIHPTVLVPALALSSLLTAWGATIRHDQPDAGYLDLALAPEYACVGKFVNSWGYSGSATLIAPD